MKSKTGNKFLVPLRPLVLCLSLVHLIGCAVGPNYRKPAVKVPQNYRGLTTEAAVSAESAASAVALPRACTAAVATTVDPAPSRHARRDVAVGLHGSDCGLLPFWLELLASGVSRMASLLH